MGLLGSLGSKALLTKYEMCSSAKCRAVLLGCFLL